MQANIDMHAGNYKYSSVARACSVMDDTIVTAHVDRQVKMSSLFLLASTMWNDMDEHCKTSKEEPGVALVHRKICPDRPSKTSRHAAQHARSYLKTQHAARAQQDVSNRPPPGGGNC